MEIKKPRLHLLAARLPVMPVTSSILSTAERGGWLAGGCGEQGIFSFPYPAIISSSTSPTSTTPPPTLQMKIFVAGGPRVKTPMIVED